MIEQKDIDLVINDFKSKSKPNDRYTSFDYCYNYFLSTNDLNVDLEKSCLVLGFYLSSWGMLRGSSFLLQHSVFHFKPTIKYINSLGKDVWEIDVDKYNEKNIDLILNIYKEIKKRLIPTGNADMALVTKVLLGVFGFIPAFDNYFCETFRHLSKGECGFRRVNKVSLSFIQNFYQENKSAIDYFSNKTFTTDFSSGEKTLINYPKAKIIDMYGFNKSNVLINEKVFEILGEGGRICIFRQSYKGEEKFFYDKRENDPTGELLDQNEKGVYLNFENPFQIINYSYPWYKLHLDTIHKDYRNYIVDKLIEKLNEKEVTPSNLEYTKGQFEKILEIELKCKMNHNVPIWSYME